MSQTIPELAVTQHAMLVIWGHYAQSLGLIKGLDACPLHQKTYTHRPQTKILQSFVAVLAGLPYLKDISHAAHPIDQDQTVARAWQQPAWADSSGISRTLHELTMAEAVGIVHMLDSLSQPIIDREVMLSLREHGRLIYDGDLTGRPVSNTSTTYPNVAYGYMSDSLSLGYQAALVSMHSPTYGRLWLSVAPHPGDTVSCTEAEAMINAAEAHTGVRPLRRTDLLQERLQSVTSARQASETQLDKRRHVHQQAQVQWDMIRQQVSHQQEIVARYAAEYQKRQRPERPHSRLAQARSRVAVYEQRQSRREQAAAHAQRRVKQQAAIVAHWQALETTLKQRLARFEQDNVGNNAPLQVVWRLDAGFGTCDNVALLIEMGYDVYSKPHSYRVTAGLRHQVTAETMWQRVGNNAELVAWSSIRVAQYPYLLDVALERFHTGEMVRYSALLHYGSDAVTADTTGWFHRYNERQTIEAGIKEGKGVFQMQHLKVRAEAALFLHEHFAVFAANFVRWTAHWLMTQCPQIPGDLPVLTPRGVKEMVQVAAHTSALVVWQAGGCLLRFTEQSVFAGTSLQASGVIVQPPLPILKSCDFRPF